MQNIKKDNCCKWMPQLDNRKSFVKKRGDRHVIHVVMRLMAVVKKHPCGFFQYSPIFLSSFIKICPLYGDIILKE